MWSMSARKRPRQTNAGAAKYRFRLDSAARKPRVEEVEDVLDAQAAAVEVGGDITGEPAVEEVEDVLHLDDAVVVVVGRAAEVGGDGGGVGHGDEARAEARARSAPADEL